MTSLLLIAIASTKTHGRFYNRSTRRTFTSARDIGEGSRTILDQ
ncbi:MAG: hypothetical protein ACOX4A_10810 [Saccharofermentanales bacterium]